MSLPQFQSPSKEMSLMQTSWASAIDPVLKNPLNNVSILKNIVLIAGQVNVINHGLQQPLQGWFPVRIGAQATLWDSQITNSTPQLTLNLNTSANVTISLGVF